MHEKECIKEWTVICDSRKIEGCWLVCFDNLDWLKEYPIIPVKEEDLKIKEN